MTHVIESMLGAIFVLIIFAAYYLGRDLEKINATLTRIAVTTESSTRLMAHDRLGTREQRGSLTLEYQESVNLNRDPEDSDFLDREIGRQLADITLMADWRKPERGPKGGR